MGSPQLIVSLICGLGFHSRADRYSLGTQNSISQNQEIGCLYGFIRQRDFDISHASLIKKTA